MQTKFIKTYILGAIFLIALGFLLFPKFTHKSITKEKAVQKLFTFKTADIDKIDLDYLAPLHINEANRKLVQLKKENSQWLETTNHNYQAVESSVKNLLEQASAINPTELVSQNPAKQESFEIDNKKGTHVKLWIKENKIADFWLGKNAVSGDATYFRLDGSDLVYTTANNIRFYFTQPDWIDRTIWKLAQDEISKISLNITKPYIVLEKQLIENKPADTTAKTDLPATKETKWQVIAPAKFETSSEKVASLLQSLTTLSATEVIFDKTIEEVGLQNSQSKVLVSLTGDNSTKELIIGKKFGSDLPANSPEQVGVGGYYVKSSDNDQIFSLPIYLIENTLSPKVDDFKVKK